MQAKMIFAIIPMVSWLGKTGGTAFGLLHNNNCIIVPACETQGGLKSPALCLDTPVLTQEECRNTFKNWLLDMLQKLVRLQKQKNSDTLAGCSGIDKASRTIWELIDDLNDPKKPLDAIILAGKTSDIKHWLTDISA